jgi:ABC-type transport system involved in cytochrome c biogenesis permease subunit
MIARITIFCFFASYGVTLALEITRLFFRSGVRGALMLGFAGAGFFAHTMFLVNRWTREGHVPLSSEFDWFLVAAWLLALCYLTLVFFHPRNSIGIFCLPLVLGLVVAAWFRPDQEPLTQVPGLGLWTWLHAGSLLVGSVAVMIGFAAGLMYLLQAYRLRHKLPPRPGFELPSLEWLGRLSERAIVASVIFLLCGFATGVVRSRLRYGSVLWSDPVVWSSCLLSVWMATVAVFNFVYKPARQGRKVAYLTVGTFLFLVLTLVALKIGHEYGPPSPELPLTPVKNEGGGI